MLETMTSFPPTSSAAARHAGKRLPVCVCGVGGSDLLNSSGHCVESSLLFSAGWDTNTAESKKDAVATGTGSTVTFFCSLWAQTGLIRSDWEHLSCVSI